MIENLRGRTAETKYGRIPLWLYDVGVSLQAIATYGWLHGKYGHFERVIPSYATLAKELKVSRGSVIAYVKELVAAGAVRIVTSGAVGQTTNLYEIAFNEPFPVRDVPVSGGQNADQVVSGLYSSGQNADQGGQPAVQEEDVPKKTKKTSSSRPRVPKPRPAAPTVTAEEEGSTATPEHRRAQLFLMRLPAPWGLGPADAARIAPQLAEAVDRLGLAYDDRLAEQIATNDFGINNFASVIETKRIPNLRPPAAKPAALSPACPACLAANPTAEHNKRFRTHNGLPAGRRCPECHPDAAPAAA